MPKLDMRPTEELTEEDFEDVRWKDTYEQQRVYLRGTRLGEFRAYGPHTVTSKTKRQLTNGRGMTFIHGAEDLMVRTGFHTF